MSESNAAAIAADNLGLAMLERIVDQFRQVPGFENLTSAQQQVHIERLDKIVRQLIAEALNIIFRAEYPACVAAVDKVLIGKNITVRLEVLRTAEYRHELMDRQGQKAVLVMADPDVYYQRMAQVKASSDQKDLFHDPNQPLGHMGVEEPPPPKGPPEDNGGGASGLEDVIPEAGPTPIGEPEALELVTPEALCEHLGRYDIDVPLEVARDQWTEDQRKEAKVWAIACDQLNEQDMPPPIPPDFIRPFVKIPTVSVDVGEEGGDRSVVLFKPLEIPDAAIDAEIIAALKLRGITVKPKMVRNWSQSQRVAAVSWLQREATLDQRPEFIPPPDEAAGT